MKGRIPIPSILISSSSTHTHLIYAAVGASLSFYLYPLITGFENWTFLVIIFIGFSVCAISFFRVIVSYPLKASPLFLRINLFLIAGIVGIYFGLSARASIIDLHIPLAQEQVFSLRGVLSDDPRAFNDSRGMGVLELSQAFGTGGLQTSAKGKVTVFFPSGTISGVKEFGRSSEIYVEGRLVSSDRGLIFRASEVHILNPAPALEQFRTGFRKSVLEKFGIDEEQAIQPVWAGLASAMLLGIRDDLDVDLATSFRRAGSSHVLSLSGLNLAILSGVIVFILNKIFGIRISSLIGAVFIIVYIFLAGSQASLVRAGIMSLLGILALWGHLKKNPLSILSLAFLIQLIIKSESGLSVSFIFSYLALAGILITGQTIREILRGKVPNLLLAGFSTSAGAFIATSAAVAFYFGDLHPIGLIAGIIIMPLAAVFLLLAFISLVLIVIIPFLFIPLNFLLAFVYQVLEFIISFAGRAPGIHTTSYIPVLIISILTIILLEFIKYMERQRRRSIASFDT